MRNSYYLLTSPALNIYAAVTQSFTQVYVSHFILYFDLTDTCSKGQQWGQFLQMSLYDHAIIIFQCSLPDIGELRSHQLLLYL